MSFFLNDDSRRLIQGVGIGLRSCHYDYILNNLPKIPWFEALTDNYLSGGPPLRYLNAIREHYPLTLHGVGMSLGSSDPLNMEYLKKLKNLAEQIEPVYISDHLCWTSVNNHYLHDLMPLPYTEEVIQHLAERIIQVQDYLGRTILIENVSSYLNFQESQMTEWEFISEITQRTDCDLLCDINNIYVSSYNHNFDAKKYLLHLDPKRIKQFHLAGYSDNGQYLFDTHSEAIHPPVWDLYQQAVDLFGNIPTLIEWDDQIPKFVDLQNEVEKARKILERHDVTYSVMSD
jgi:uncharacterized protein (UPF0276 family)